MFCRQEKAGAATLRSDRKCAGGFTLVEVQIALLVLIIAIYSLGGHHRIMNGLLRDVVNDRRATGEFSLTKERAVIMLAREGASAGPPECDVKVNSLNTSGTYPKVFVRVQEAPW